MTSPVIALATGPGDIRRCFPVMHQLRGHLDADRFVALVGAAAKESYRLAFAEADGQVTAVAGFRIMTMLYVNGPLLYVDDLITDASRRSSGHGHLLMQWLVAYAREHGCLELHLDSGVQRFDAHRFYLRERMHISSYHFRLPLG